jgi:hypothetical protein
MHSFLNNQRDDSIRIMNENKTLHSILTSTSRVKTPTTRRFCMQKFGFNIKEEFILAVFLSPPSSSSSSSSTTTSLHIDCNIKTETTNNSNTAAITRAFDNLAKAASHVIIFVFV